MSEASATVPKKSYSPFGSKPMAVVNDFLYAPPASQSMQEPEVSPPDSPVQDDFSSFEESNPVEVAPESSDYAPPYEYEPTPVSPEASTFSSNLPPQVPKSSYSPFGGGKPVSATNDSLYGPPSSQVVSDDDYYTSPDTETIGSTAAFVDPGASTAPPQSYSPFGGAKPTSSYNDSLYAAPTTDGISDSYPTEEDSSPPFAASGLDDTPGADVPETTAFRASPMKKSFSPFGSIPKAPDGRGGNNDGGYLDGL